MPSITRSIFLALHAAAFIAFTGLSGSTSTVASPIPFPLIVADHAPRLLFASRIPRRDGGGESSRIQPTREAPSSEPLTPFTSNASLHPRDLVSDLLNSLGTYTNQMISQSAQLKSYASQSAFVKDGDYDFQHNCASQLSLFQGSLSSTQDILSQLGADKGLEYYDRTNDIETLLKDGINANKDALNSVAVLIENDPTLGPILGPTVYEIKCILDEVLDAIENLTDAIINVCQPLLKALLPSGSSCTGTILFGLCL